MKRLGVILTSVITSLITALVVVWFSEALVQIVPSPQRLWLRVENVLAVTPSRADASFRIVLCWLENDWSGEDTRNVEDAFSGVEGITLVVSDEDIAASGAADQWRPAMQRRALAILEEWNADVAIIGSVKRSGEALALWFVPRWGEGTLRRADRHYTLEMATLGADFHEDLRTQLAVMAWNSIAPLVNAEKRGRVFEKGLQAGTEKLSRLLGTPTITKPEHRAALYIALGDGLSTLGSREPGTDRLGQAVEAYRRALTTYGRQDAPLEWARVHNSLGLALKELGDRQADKGRLEQAVVAFQAALEVFSQERTPVNWAAVQGHLGTALRRIGELEAGTARLEHAIAAHRAALAVFTRERAPDDWAFEQDHLGNALSKLGERMNSIDLLEQALDAHRAALSVLSRERKPFSWATTQYNLGSTLMALGRRENGTASLELAVEAYGEALRERTRERTPLDWALTKNNLGRALYFLGERKQTRNLWEEAEKAYRAALEVLENSGELRYRDMARNNLDEVVRGLQESGPRPSVPE